MKRKLVPIAPQPARISSPGSRVFLRPPQPTDQREFLALRRASRDFHAPFEVRPPPGVDATGPRAFRAFLEQGPGRGRERWLICSEKTEKILGAISLSAIRGEPFRSAVIGYWIGQPHARRGYMKEALPLALRRAFGKLALRRVEAAVLPENLASKRVLRSVGFLEEGLSRDYVRVAGRWRDHERWALLSRDWKGGRRTTRRVRQ